MRILVLGGTRFVGRAIVDEAVRRGYEVTTFSRGLTGRPNPKARALHGDRTNHADLAVLADDDWDSVVDTSMLAPAHVRASARLLAPKARHYTYISSVSAYRGWPSEPVTEDSALHDCEPGEQHTVPYGPMKAGSERAVAESFANRCLLLRPGLLVGPREDLGRLSWWLTRVARGGRMPVPGPASRPLCLTDARDLAIWALEGARRSLSGALSIPGRSDGTFGDLLATCSSVVAAAAEAEPQLVWMSDDALVAAGTRPEQLPMWFPETSPFGALWQVSGDRAIRAGMTYRPLQDTVRATWRWICDEAAAQGTPPAGAQVERHPLIGLDPSAEAGILAYAPQDGSS